MSLKIEIEKENIDFYEKICNDILKKIFNVNPNEVLLTDLSTILDFSFTIEELNSDINKILEIYGINVRLLKDFKILTLCKEIEKKDLEKNKTIH